MHPQKPFQRFDLIANTLAKAQLHLNSGRLSKAERLVLAATKRAPDHFGAALFLGALYVIQNKIEHAITYLEKAVLLQPDNVDALQSLGIALYNKGNEEEGIQYFCRICEINPNHALSLMNVGRNLYQNGIVEEAIGYFDRALNCGGEVRKPLFNKGLALLSLGQYREGWKLYEEGFGDIRGVNIFAPVEPWNGEPMPGKHLLIWCEQGLGDCLQFIRYAELCRTRFGKVSVLCKKDTYSSLLRLFSALPFIDDVFDRPDYKGRNNFDTHVAMMSLPHRFDTVLETVPHKVPYLRVPAEIQANWAPKFASIAEFKVGLAWAGGARFDRDKRRSIDLQRMQPLFDLEGARFYSLQKDKAAKQIAELGLADRFTDFMAEVEDFADTAAIIQNLDLVISVDTAVAHLAGGLGKPVWILSRYDADWRWLRNRPTSPWYPTARIFGQPAMGEWDSVIAEVRHELKAEIEKRAPRRGSG